MCYMVASFLMGKCCLMSIIKMKTSKRQRTENLDEMLRVENALTEKPN